MSKPVSCPLWFFPEMPIRLTGKVNTCRAESSFGRSGQSLNGSSSPFKEGHPTNPWQDVFFYYLCSICFLLPRSRKTKWTQTRQFHLQKCRSGQPCNYKNQIFGSGRRGSFSSPWRLREQPSRSAGTSMTRADGPFGVGSQHHLPEIAKPKAHTSRFWAVWSGADTAFQRREVIN